MIVVIDHWAAGSVHDVCWYSATCFRKGLFNFIHVSWCSSKTYVLKSLLFNILFFLRCSIGSEQTVELKEIMGRAGWSHKYASLNRTDFAVPENVTPDTSIEAHVSGKRLLLENRGHCPNDCYAVIVIKDNNNHTLYNHSSKQTFWEPMQKILFHLIFFAIGAMFLHS